MLAQISELTSSLLYVADSSQSLRPHSDSTVCVRPPRAVGEEPHTSFPAAFVHASGQHLLLPCISAISGCALPPRAVHPPRVVPSVCCEGQHSVLVEFLWHEVPCIDLAETRQAAGLWGAPPRLHAFLAAGSLLGPLQLWCSLCVVGFFFFSSDFTRLLSNSVLLSV